MAITLENTIPQVGLVKNPIVCKLSTDNMVVDAGSKASIIIVFDITSGSAGDEVNAGDILQITFGLTTIKFTFVDTDPDNSGTQLKTNIDGDSTSDWVSSNVVPYLLQNYLLDKKFTIEKTAGTATTAEIAITAKEIGTEYSMTVVETMQNGSEKTNTSGVDKEIRDNFKILLDVYVERVYESDSFLLVGSLGYQPDENNITIFPIDDILYSELLAISDDNNNNIPRFNDTSLRISKTFIRYYFQYTEYYGDPPTHKKKYKSAIFFAMLGGLKFLDYPGTDYFSTWLPANKRFLSWKSTTRIVSESQQEYLSYLIYKASTTSTIVKLKMFYSDGTSSTTEAHNQVPIYQNQKEVYTIPVGYSQIDIDTKKTAGKTVAKYQIWVVEQNPSVAIISETITFKVDRDNYTNERCFIYFNSIGGIDTLRCTGRRQDIFKISRLHSERILYDYWSDSQTSLGQYLNPTNQYQEKYVISTGYKSRKEAVQCMKDFLISSAVREIRNGEFVPVIILDDSIKIFKDDDYSYFLEFEYRDAFSNTSYSDI